MVKKANNATSNKKKDDTPLAQLTRKVDTLTKNLPKGTFGKVGATVGSVAGPKGAILGGLLGQGIATITGRGDYVVRGNTLAKEGGVMASGVPRFVNNTLRNVRVSHRECFGSVSSPATPANFALSAYAINPGNEVLFPWLSSIASNYEKYKIHGAVVYFESSSSDYAAAGALGNVIIATNYNAAEVPWSDDVSMLNSEFAVAGKPSFSLAHPLECAPAYGGNEDFLYVRDPASIPSGAATDARLFDMGVLQIATRGLSATTGTELGRLWITYDIEFVRPLINPSGSLKYGGTSFTATSGTPMVSALAQTSTRTSFGANFARCFASAALYPGLSVNDAVVIVPNSATNREFTVYVNRDMVIAITAELTGTGMSGAGSIVANGIGGAVGTVIGTPMELVSSTEATSGYTVAVVGASARPEAYVALVVTMVTGHTTFTSFTVTVTAAEGTARSRTITGNLF